MDSIKKICDKAYRRGTPLIDDEEYDTLFPEDGEGPADDEGRAPLPFWMGSLNKVRDEKKLQSWLNKNQTQVYIITEKIDGISGLLHENKLYSRGNGMKGTNLSAALPYLAGIPRTDRSVRGELVMKNKVFEEKYAGDYKNPRNLVAGAFGRKHLDKNVLADISFIAYEIVSEDVSPSLQLALLKDGGFEVPHTVLHYNSMTITDLSDHLTKFQDVATVAIDGLVLQPDERYDRNTEGNPSYSIAFKRDTDENMVVGNVVEVEWNVSKWGLYKPVIRIHPVDLMGVTIRKLTAFNAKFVVDNQLGADSQVLIKRSGDVIPHIVKVLTPSTNINLPSSKWDGVDLRAGSTEDDTVAIKTLVGMFAALDIKFVGTSTVEKLYNGGINTLPKILTATVGDLVTMGLGQKTSERIVTNLHKGFFGSKPKLSVLVGSSGVLGYGIGSKRIEAVFEAIPNFTTQCPSFDTLLQCRGVSHVIATKILGNHSYMIKFIKLLTTLGIKFEDSKKSGGQKYCLSGFRNKDIPNVVDTVTKDCILIVKDMRETSKKIERAKALNIPIISKNDYFANR